MWFFTTGTLVDEPGKVVLTRRSHQRETGPNEGLLSPRTKLLWRHGRAALEVDGEAKDGVQKAGAVNLAPGAFHVALNVPKPVRQEGDDVGPNPEFFSHNRFNPGTVTQCQKPVGAIEGHLSYDVKKEPRLWVSLDANFWFGGSTSLNGVENRLTVQGNSRIGATVAVPITKHQALKFSYSNGAYTRYGGNYQNVSVAWQYSWLGKPR